MSKAAPTFGKAAREMRERMGMERASAGSFRRGDR